MPEEESSDDSTLLKAITIEPIVRGYISDWDAMEDLLHHLVYTSLGWEIGNEGHILFADPLLTPKVTATLKSEYVNRDFELLRPTYASESLVLIHVPCQDFMSFTQDSMLQSKLYYHSMQLGVFLVALLILVMGR